MRPTAMLALALTGISLSASAAPSTQPRWSEQRANAWYAQQPWLVGANYIPSNAINELTHVSGGHLLARHQRS